MNRPRRTWLLFFLCVGLGVVVLGALSRIALRLDHAQREAREQADLQERARLALWRMDSLLLPLLIEESVRATAIASPSRLDQHGTEPIIVEHANDPLAFRVSQPAPAAIPSSGVHPVLLRFEMDEHGAVTSLQSVASTGSGPSTQGSNIASPDSTAANRIAALKRLLEQPVDPVRPEWIGRRFLLHELRAPGPPPLFTPPEPVPALAQPPTQTAEQQELRNTFEFTQRANFLNVAQQQAVLSQIRPLPPSDRPASSPQPDGGLLRPLWLGDALLLARQAQRGETRIVQGCWLDWADLKSMLLGGVRDLLPEANLEPAQSGGDQDQARLLAVLPAQLATGRVPAVSMPLWTPVRITLALAWGGMLVAVGAVALLLHGTMSLSERRAAFVSAVTHELRTPLTTFRMYAEMLANGMVADETHRARYLSTLHAESIRLSHLVENVLAYARLEPGTVKTRRECLTVDAMIDRVLPRLEQRAEQAEFRLEVERDPHVVTAMVRLDVTAIEQILFNLVDNACKHAAPAAREPVIHLEVGVENNRFVQLRVRDHGPGLSTDAVRTLFEPFGKPADEAAGQAPGVGLGLALSRRLSRNLGGDLRWEPDVADGASFLLRIPAESITGCIPRRG